MWRHNQWDPWSQRASSVWSHRNPFFRPFFDPFYGSDFDDLIEHLQWHRPFLLDNTHEGESVQTQCGFNPRSELHKEQNNGINTQDGGSVNCLRCRQEPSQGYKQQERAEGETSEQRNHRATGDYHTPSNQRNNQKGVNDKSYDHCNHQEANNGLKQQKSQRSASDFHQNPRQSNQRHQSNHQQHPVHQQPTMPTTNLQSRPVAFAELDVTGYRSDELDIWTEGNRVIVKGHHKCDCDDACLVTEFQRTYTMPRGLDSKTVKAKYGKDGKLILQGTATKLHRISQDREQVEIDYQGPKEAPRETVQCQRKQAGIPLKKVKVPKRDRKQDNVPENDNQIRNRFEGEMEDDGVTIEVVE